MARIGSLDGFWPALSLSLQLALLSTAISLVLGTLAAIAIARGKLPGAQAIATALVSPLMMPGLVLGIALLQYFRGDRLQRDLDRAAARPCRGDAALCRAHYDRRAWRASTSP